MKFRMAGNARKLKGYNFSSDTKEFIGDSDVYIPPHTGLPANCTIIAPPDFSVGYIAVFDQENEQWNMVEDFRNQSIWSKISGLPVFIDFLGPLPEELTAVAPTDENQVWNGNEWVYDKNKFKSALAGKCEGQRSILLAHANEYIADWRTELQLDVITEQDKTSLKNWMVYIKALKELNFDEVETQEDFEGFSWPTMP